MKKLLLLVIGVLSVPYVTHAMQSDIMPSDIWKGFPLHKAAWNGDYIKIEEILTRHQKLINKPYNSPFDVNQDFTSNTPLLFAMNGEEEAVVSLLLKKGANPNQQCVNRSTPLHLAVLLEKTNFVRLLLGHGAQINIKNKFGKTPLDLAKTEDMRELLCQYMPKEPVTLAAPMLSSFTWLQRIWNMVPSKKVIASTTVLALAGYAAWRIWRR
jgi:hypothetical protein